MAGDYGTRTASQRIWLVGAAGLFAVLTLGGGWLAWRGLSSRPPSLASAAMSESSGAAVPVAFGAPDLIEGVPWGFPLTPDGAASAAVTAVAATGQLDAVFDPGRFDEVAAVVFTDAQAEVQAGQVHAARTEFDLSGWADQPPSRRMYFLTPLAVRLTEWDPQRLSATVEVWAMTLVGVGDAGGAVFTTSSVDLIADGPTWRVAGLDSVEGPTPMVAAPASAPGRTRALVRDALPAVPLPLPAGARP